MKILHTADWHLGNTFHGHNRTGEHRHFLDWLLNIIKERQPDALLITGNVFDTAYPSAKAEELLFHFLLQATTVLPGLQIVLIAGDLDPTGCLESSAELFKTRNVYLRDRIYTDNDEEPDYGHYILPLSERTDNEARCVCLAVPYLHGGNYPEGLTPEAGMEYFFKKLHKELRKSDFKKLPVIAAAHFLADGAAYSSEEQATHPGIGEQNRIHPSVLGDRISYTALGHLHKSQQVPGEKNVYYAGCPLPMSFDETELQQGINEVELYEDGNCEITRLSYRPLRRVLSIPAQGKPGTSEEILKEINELEQRGKNEDGSHWPYLEIRVDELQPDPAFFDEVMESLDNCAVHFCRMVSTGHATHSSKKTDSRPLSISPLQIARRHFEMVHGNDMSQELIDRFKLAEKAAQSETNNGL